MRGRVREEGEPQAPALAIPPLSNSPPQGGIGHTVRGHSSHLQTAARPRIPRRELRPGCAKETSAPRKRRAWGMPGAGSHPQPRVQKQQSTRAQVTAGTGRNRPAFPHANGFNGFLRALPGDRALLSPSPADHPADLTPASRRQNHTTSPSAFQARSSTAPKASTASRTQRP